jgi:hypothetical protein
MEDLKGMTKVELQKEATKLKIEFKSNDTKADLIKAIEKARKASVKQSGKKTTQAAAARPKKRVFNAMLHRYEYK